MPPTNGVRHKVYSVLSYMATRHECHVLSFGQPGQLRDAHEWEQLLPGLRVLGVLPPRRGPQLVPLQLGSLAMSTGIPSAVRWSTAAFAAAVSRACAGTRYDVIHLDMINLAGYRRLAGEIPIILSANDAVSLAYSRRAEREHNPVRRIMLQLLSRRLLSFERTRYPQFTRVHVVSGRDAEYLKERAHLGNVVVIPLAADPRCLNVVSGLHVSPAGLTVFASGLLSLPYIRDPLCTFVAERWGEVAARFSSVRLVIVGRGAPPSVIAFLRQARAVEFHGWVEDYASAMAPADVALFLDCGGTGVKTRVVQALAAGKATVGTSYAFEGIEVEHGVHCYISDDQDEICRYVSKLLASPELRGRLGQSARELVLARYTQEAVGKRWEDLYAEVSRHRSRTSA